MLHLDIKNYIYLARSELLREPTCQTDAACASAREVKQSENTCLPATSLDDQTTSYPCIKMYNNIYIVNINYDIRSLSHSDNPMKTVKSDEAVGDFLFIFCLKRCSMF